MENFSDSIVLFASGNPAGTTTSFSVNPITPSTPPATSLLTIDNISGNIAGSYQIEITGLAPTSTHMTAVHLHVFDSLNGAPNLLSPANGATDVPLMPHFSWGNLSGAASYRLEIATDVNFTNIVYAANTSTTSHTPTTKLGALATYYWRVRGSNVCGNGSYAAPFSLETTAVTVYLPLVVK